MALKLYQFAISHYCEKVRWALDYKGLNYQSVNLLPGQHVKTIRQLTRADSSVPVLEHDGQIIQGSSAILDYLDQTFPERSLTPSDPKAKAEALAWEQRLDDEVGPAIRCFAYHHLLQRPKAVIPMLTAGTPFYNRLLLGLVFSRVDETMRKWMKINEKTSEQSRQTMDRLLTELAEVYQRQPYLVGNQFTRADLTAAALFAPMFEPGPYPVPWPKPRQVPKVIAAWQQQWQGQLEPLAELYRRHRLQG